MINPKIFFDSSALFSSIYSSTGAAAELIRRSHEGEIEILISPEVLVEVRRNIRRKAPDLEADIMDRNRSDPKGFCAQYDGVLRSKTLRVSVAP